MQITVDYRKRQYGFGDHIRRYTITLKDVRGFYMDKPITADSKSYNTRELRICFNGHHPTPGRGWGELCEAELVGGSLKLSYDAAQELADGLKIFLDERKTKGIDHCMTIEVDEKPEPDVAQPPL